VEHRGGDEGPRGGARADSDPAAVFAAAAARAAHVPHRGGGPFGYPSAGVAAATGRSAKGAAGSFADPGAYSGAHSDPGALANVRRDPDFGQLLQPPPTAAESGRRSGAERAALARAGRHLTAGAEAGDPVSESCNFTHASLRMCTCLLVLMAPLE
jgi:hypothetical protein